MTRQNAQDEIWRRNRLIILSTIVLVRGGYTMVIPFLPFYLQELGVEGVTSTAIWSGLTISVAPLLAALVGPWWGQVADQSGLKRISLRVMSAFLLSWLIFSVASSPYHLLLARLIAGVFGGYLGLSIPLVTAGCPPEKLNRAIGSVNSTRILSAALGPLVGGVLAGLIGIRSTALLTALFHVGALILIAFVYVPLGDSSRSTTTVKLSALFKMPALMTVFAILFLTSFVDRGIDPIVPLAIVELGGVVEHPTRVAGLILGIAATASAVAAWAVGRFGESWNPVRVIRLLGAIGVLVSIGLALSRSNLELGVARTMIGLLTGGVLTAAYVLGDASIPSGSKVSGMAILASGFLLGGALGPLLIGLLGFFGVRIPLGAGTVVFSLMIWIAGFSRKVEP